ncbi:hypothetical protein IWZ01DRAFT_362575 [Phyllosticta capitalensis]
MAANWLVGWVVGRSSLPPFRPPSRERADGRLAVAVRVFSSAWILLSVIRTRFPALTARIIVVSFSSTSLLQPKATFLPPLAGSPPIPPHSFHVQTADLCAVLASKCTATPARHFIAEVSQMPCCPVLSCLNRCFHVPASSGRVERGCSVFASASASVFARCDGTECYHWTDLWACAPRGR